MNVDSHSDASELHKALVDHIKQFGGIQSTAVEEAFRAIPRHLFLSEVPFDQVYRDDAVVIKKEGERPLSSSSQPSLMAMMLEQLDLEPGHQVLEIGAGTGYNAALMAHLVGETGRVTTIDIDEDIAAGARENLVKAGFERVDVICGDGADGVPNRGPYDRIIVTAGAADIVPAWREQLKPTGQIIVPLALMPGGGQRIIAFEHSEQCLVSTSFIMGGFMPLRGAFPGQSPNEGRRHIQLGPEPGLQLHLREDDPREVDPQAIYQLLTGARQDLPTGIQVTSHELLSRYATWSAFVGRQQEGSDLECGLTAQGEMVDRGLIPYLLGLAGKFCSTGGLLKEQSLAVYVRPTVRTLPEAWPEEEPPSEIWVRSYGPDETLAACLIERIRQWDAAGRPIDEERLRVRAYPQATDYTASANEIIIEREFTRLVIDW